jgi:alpha-beta hydrolase superfamily lysophospholipase
VFVFLCRNRQVTQRAEESIEALKMLKSLNAGQFGSSSVMKPFDKKNKFSLASLQGRMNTDEDVVICGHSFGGGAVIKTLDLDHQKVNSKLNEAMTGK